MRVCVHTHAQTQACTVAQKSEDGCIDTNGMGRYGYGSGEAFMEIPLC